MLVLVTTCPGRDYLCGTLASLAAAGFDNVRIVVDEFQRGARWNFRRALWEAQWANVPYALVVQDDVLVAPGLRAHVAREALVGPPRLAGVVTYHDCSLDFPFGTKDGEYLLPVENLEGAQCLLLPQRSIRALLAEPNWADGGPHNVDFWIGKTLSQSPWPLKLVVRRGFVEHVGRKSLCHPERKNHPQDTQTVHDLPLVGPEDSAWPSTT